MRMIRLVDYFSEPITVELEGEAKKEFVELFFLWPLDGFKIHTATTKNDIFYEENI